MNDAERQILIRLRAEGEGVADRLKDEIARLVREKENLIEKFSRGAVLAGEYREGIAAINRPLADFSRLLKEAEDAMNGTDAATVKHFQDLQKLEQQMARLNAEADRMFEAEAKAAESAAQRESQAFADAAAKHEQFLAREEAAAESAALKEAESFADLTVKHEAMLARRAAAEEAAELREAEAVARGAAAHEAAMAREEAAREKAEMADAEALARGAAAAEARYAREEAAAERAEEKDAELLAKKAANAEAAEARREAAAEKAAVAQIREIDRATRAVQEASTKIDAILERDATERERRELADAQELATAAERHERMMGGNIRSTTEAASRYNSLSFSILATGHAFQDLTSSQDSFIRGLSSTLNNIPLLVTGWAQFAGVATSTAMAWAGGLTIVASGAMSLYQNWDRLMGLFGTSEEAIRNATSGLEELGKKIKELEGKKVKVAVDIQELDAARERVEEIEAALKAVDQLRKSRSHYEQESGQQIKKLLEEAEGGAQAVSDAMRREVVRTAIEQSGTIAQSRRTIAATEAQLPGLEAKARAGAGTEEGEFAEHEIRVIKDTVVPALYERIHEATSAITQAGGAADQMLGDILERAQSGVGAEQAAGQRQLIDLLDLVGRPELATGVQALRPEHLEFREADAKREEEGLERMKRQAQEAEERQRAIQQDVARVAQPFEAGDYRDKLRRDILEGVKARKTDEEIAAQLRPGLEAAAEEVKVSPDLIEGVARKVLADELRKAKGDLAARGVARPEAAAAILGEEQAEAEEKVQREREAAARKVEAAERKEEAAIRPEVQRIVGALGDEMGARFRNLMAENLGLMEAGVPVARSAREERKLEGTPYALPSEELAGRLVSDMERIMQARGATPEAAREAARQIAERGGIQLTREAVATPAQPKVARRQQAEIQRQEKAMLRAAKQQRPAPARRFGARPAPAPIPITTGWRGALAAEVIGAVSTPEPVRAPTPVVLPPEPVVQPRAEVRPAPPIEPPIPRVRATAPEVLPAPPVSVPGAVVETAPPEVRAHPPVRVPAPRVEPPPPADIPPPVVPMPSTVRIPPPIVEGAPLAVAPRPRVMVPDPDVPPPRPVRIAPPAVVPGAAPPGRARGAPEPAAPIPAMAMLGQSQEAAVATMGQLQGQQQAIMEQQRDIQSQLMALQANARRMRVRQPSLLPTLGFGSL